MKPSLLAFSLVALTACGIDSDDTELPEDGNHAAVAGGAGGSAGTSGAGGIAGGGASGAGGTAGGGASGAGGMAGMGGAAGASGGTGGAGSGGAGSGGAGASGSSGGGVAGAAGKAGSGGSGAGGVPTAGAGGAGTGGSAGTGGVGGCTAAAAGVEIAQVDPYGWPPYAIDGCRLVYVAVSSTGDPKVSGELRLRDLSSGQEELLAPESEAARRPGIAGNVIAWEATIAGVSSIRVRFAGNVTTLSGAFDHAAEPRVAADGVVFTGFSASSATSDTEIFLYQPSGSGLTAITSSPGQQRWADISLTHIAWADFSEDPDGTFDDNATDVADIVLFDRKTQLLTLHPREGKEGYPVLTGDAVAFLHWPAFHPEPKDSAYELSLWPAAKGGPDVHLADVYQWDGPGGRHARPSGRDGVVAWVDGNVAYVTKTDPPAAAKANVNLGGASAQAALLLDGATVVSAVAGGKSRLFVGP